jgi:hypothetical protein
MITRSGRNVRIEEATPPVNEPVRREARWIHRRCDLSNAIEQRAGKVRNAHAISAIIAEVVAGAAGPAVVIVVEACPAEVEAVSGVAVAGAKGMLGNPGVW